MTAGIYRIVNTVTNGTYLGSSVNVDERLHRHGQKLRDGKHFNAHLQASWQKHGEHSFLFEALVECGSDQLAQREQQFIDAYDEHDLPLYNKRQSAESRRKFRYIPTPETCAKISAANRGRKKPPMSAETRARLSEALKGNKSWKGRSLSPEHRAKISARHKGKQFSLGYKHTPEECERRRTAQTGKVLSAETRAKIGASNTGRHLSPEHRAKIVASNIRRTKVLRLWAQYEKQIPLKESEV